METQRRTVRSTSRRRPTTNGARTQRAQAKSADLGPLAPPSTDSWWDVDLEVLSALADGAKSPEDIGASLGMSPDAVTSLVTLLAQQGKVRIRLIEAAG